MSKTDLYHGLDGLTVDISHFVCMGVFSLIDFYNHKLWWAIMIKNAANEIAAIGDALP